MSALALHVPTYRLSRGQGEVAQTIRKSFRAIWETLQQSISLGQQANGTVDRLVDVYLSCASRNWDGYGAEPVTMNTTAIAYLFLQALPLGSSSPDVGADPDGDITLEWYKGPTHLLSLSIAPDMKVHFAATLGERTAFGAEPFDGTIIPAPIRDLIARVAAL